MTDIEMARASFERYDADKDGFVTPEEFTRAMAEMGDPYVTVPVAEAVISAKDTDGDKRMSFEEYWAALNRV